MCKSYQLSQEAVTSNLFHPSTSGTTWKAISNHLRVLCQKDQPWPTPHLPSPVPAWGPCSVGEQLCHSQAPSKSATDPRASLQAGCCTA